jgi:diguanylate cyclase (GGDEF)-like protein/PAS domain S-box-containing protein
LLQIAPVRLSHEGEVEALHLEEAFLVAMAVYLSVPEVLAAMGVAQAIGQLRYRRPWTKAAFNTGQLLLAAGTGTALAHWLGGDPGTFSARAVVAAVAGGLVFSVLSMLAVAGIIRLASGTPLRTGVLDGLDIRIATWGGALSMGALIAVAMAQSSWMLAVSILPIGILQLTYRRSFHQYRQRRQMERLYHAAAAIRAAVDPKAVREELIGAAYALLDASDVRLPAIVSRPAPGSMRSTLDSTTAIEVIRRDGAEEWNENERFMLQAITSVASSALANATLYEQVRTITGSLAEGVIALDHLGNIEFVNPAVQTIVGWREEDLLGRSPDDVLHAHDPRSPGGTCPLVAPLRTGRTDKDSDAIFTCRDGSGLPVAYTTSPVVREGQLVGAVIAFHDITERKHLEQRLTHQAFHDALTGLPNRELFLDRLGHAQARIARRDGLYGLLFIDVDRFKVVNDSLGHQAGDDLLVQFADRLRQTLRSGDTLARFGGDEFVALLEDLDTEEEAVAVAERLLVELRQPFSISQRDVAMSCSIGVVIGDGTHRDPEECVRQGDIAMYRAKALGKGRFERFDPALEEDDIPRLDLEIALRNALERDELELHYQPVVAAATGRITGLEALVRWRHPTRGLISPVEFIPLAEETGLILPLGRWVLEEASRQVKAWEDTVPESADVVVSVNLSPRQFRQPDLDREVARVLAHTGLAPQRLCVEVTEGVMVDDVELATHTLQKLADLGVTVSVDDFGTGYSSLSYLKRFPIDYVKIDRSFIRGLGREKVDSEIVRSVIRLAAAIGIRAVAEGVETEDQLSQLRDLGCPLVQGYHLAPPQPPEQMLRMLVENFGLAPTAA